MNCFDTVIIGAGVVGGMVARELTRLGQRVAIVERTDDVATGASRANSGIVHAGYDAQNGSLKAKLNVRGSAMMEALCHEMDVAYERCGSLVVGFDEADRETLTGLLARGRNNGVEGLTLLSGDEARAKEPALSETVTCALWAPTGAIVCPYELTVAAVGVAMKNGAALYCNFEVSALSHGEDGWQITAADGRILAAARVVNCAGTHSDEIARMAGDDRFTVHARRGEYLLLDKECAGFVHATVFMAPSKMGKGVLVSPTAHGNIIVGPTAVDTDDRDDTKTTAAGLDDVRRLAQKSVRGLPLRSGITCFAGLRAVGSTGDFIIDRPLPGFFNCAAIESPGLSASPAIATYVAELFAEDGAVLAPRPDFDGSYVSPVSFKRLSDDEKNRIIAKDPRYGRVICRCETVTEGEIVAALHTEPKPRDLDAVKRRTRCGMGRCQGGFCTPYVTGIIARELGIPETDVTKSGGDSRLLVGKTK